MTTPTTPPFDRCPTPACIFGRLHTGLCRNRAGSALVAENASPFGYLRTVDVTVDGEPVPAPDFSRPGSYVAAVARMVATAGPAPADEIVPYTPAQQANDLREALETPCTCGQPGGHALNCPRRPLQLHAEIAASIERGEIDAPATLGTEVHGLLYYWQGVLLGWTVLRTGTLAELFPGGLTLAHRCGTEIALPDVFRLADLVAAAAAHHRECARG